MSDLEHYVFGKQQPNAADLEAAVLGAVILNDKAINQISTIIKPKDMYMNKHQLIYESMMRMFKEGRPIDMLTLTEQLKKDGSLSDIGGPPYIAELARKVGSSANIESHARIVAQKSISRDLIHLSGKTLEKCYSEATDPFELASDVEKSMLEIFGRVSKHKTTRISDSSLSFISELEARKEGELTGVPSGLVKLDEITGGFQNSDLITIAGRPGMGKTALINSIMNSIAIDQKIPAAMFSLEMNTNQQLQRIVSMRSGIPLFALRNKRLSSSDFREVNSVMSEIDNAPFFVNDTAGLTMIELKSELYRLKIMHDIKIAFIDYLQLMGDDGSSKRAQVNQNLFIGHLSQSIKNLARDLNIPIVLLSQLSRSVEQRADKKPMLSDLRDSGSIEQDSDIVIFPFRPSYYGIEEYEDGTPTAGTAEIEISKHRNGACRSLLVGFREQNTEFFNLEEDKEPYSYRSPVNDDFE